MKSAETGAVVDIWCIIAVAAALWTAAPSINTSANKNAAQSCRHGLAIDHTLYTQYQVAATLESDVPIAPAAVPNRWCGNREWLH